MTNVQIDLFIRHKVLLFCLNMCLKVCLMFYCVCVSAVTSSVGWCVCTTFFALVCCNLLAVLLAHWF